MPIQEESGFFPSPPLMDSVDEITISHESWYHFLRTDSGISLGRHQSLEDRSSVYSGDMKLFRDTLFAVDGRNFSVYARERSLEAGKREVWKDMYQFYRFEGFESVPKGVAMFRGTPDYENIVNTLWGCENCFAFGDWMIMSFAYAIRLYSEATAVNEVYVIFEDQFKKIADSFTGFLEMLDRDSDELLF